MEVDVKDLGSRMDVGPSGVNTCDADGWVDKQGRLFRCPPYLGGNGGWSEYELFDSDDLWSDAAYVLHGEDPEMLWVWIGGKFEGCSCNHLEESESYAADAAASFMRMENLKVPSDRVRLVVEGKEPDAFWDYFVLG